MAKTKKTEVNVKPSKVDELFTLVKNQDGSVAIVVGEFKAVPKDFEDFKAADAYIATKPYKLIFNTLQILMNYAQKQKEQTVEENK